MSLFGGAVSIDTVSRAWRKVQSDWQAWQGRDLSQEDMIRLILDGTVVKVRRGKRVSTLSLLVVLGVRRDGQKVLLAVKTMGGETEAAWRAVLEDFMSPLSFKSRWACDRSPRQNGRPARRTHERA